MTNSSSCNNKSSNNKSHAPQNNSRILNSQLQLTPTSTATEAVAAPEERPAKYLQRTGNRKRPKKQTERDGQTGETDITQERSATCPATLH